VTGRAPGAPARRAATVAGVVAVYTAAVAVFTWPLPRHAWDHLPDPVTLLGAGAWPYVWDMQHHAWGLAWLARALTTAPLGLYEAPILHPAPEALAYTEHFLGHAPVAVPTYLASRNPVLTFNAVLLSSLLGGALTMHALARWWTGSHAAALAAGFAYALNARRLLPSFWLEYVGALWLPLVPLLLVRWAERGRPRTLAALAAVLTLQTLCSYYLGYAAFLAAALTGAVLLVRGRLRGRRAALAVAAGAGAAALVVVVSEPYLRLHAGEALPPITLRNAQLGSLALPNLAPGGQWFPGWTVLALGALGLVRRAAHGARAVSIALLAGGLLFALGPHAHVAGVAVPLPYRAFHAFVPGFAAVRFPVLLMATAEVGLAALVGLGAAALVRRPPWAAAAVGAAAAALVAWDLGARARMAVRPLPVAGALPSVYRALAAAPPGGAVLDLPMGGTEDPRGSYRDTLAMVLGTYHWRPLLNGYSDFAPPSYDLLTALAGRLPEAESLAALVELTGVRWIVLHAAAPDPGWASLERGGAVRRIAAVAGDTLFEVLLPGRRDLRARVREDLYRPATRSLEGTPLTALPAGALDGGVRVEPPPARVLPGQFVAVAVRVENGGDATWPGLGVRTAGLVVVELRWLAADVAETAAPVRTWRLPRDLRPGDAARVAGRMPAPHRRGRWLLDVRLRQDLPGGPTGTPVQVPVTVDVPAARGQPRAP
jgi:hypothetical protein